MSSGKRKFEFRRPAVVDVDCGCGSGPKLYSSFFPKSKSKPRDRPYFTASTTTITTNSLWEPSAAATISSPVFLMTSPTARRSRQTSTVKEEEKKKSGAAGTKRMLRKECVAVMKESSEPYADFRESMLQMILETEISAWEDLRSLLHHYLDLNAPIHHPLIIRAFAEVWHALFFVAPAAAADVSSPSSQASTSSNSSGSSISASPLRR